VGEILHVMIFYILVFNVNFVMCTLCYDKFVIYDILKLSNFFSIEMYLGFKENYSFEKNKLEFQN
jgi:hypothetical protein